MASGTRSSVAGQHIVLGGANEAMHIGSPALGYGVQRRGVKRNDAVRIR